MNWNIFLPVGATVATAAEACWQFVTVRSFDRASCLKPVSAVNAEFADASTILRDGDEIAWMPPMSGGAALPLLTQEAIDLAGLSRVG